MNKNEEWLLTDVKASGDEAELERRIEVQLFDQNGFEHVKNRHCKYLNPQERVVSTIFM